MTLLTVKRIQTNNHEIGTEIYIANFNTVPTPRLQGCTKPSFSPLKYRTSNIWLNVFNIRRISFPD